MCHENHPFEHALGRLWAGCGPLVSTWHCVGAMRPGSSPWGSQSVMSASYSMVSLPGGEPRRRVHHMYNESAKAQEGMRLKRRLGAMKQSFQMDDPQRLGLITAVKLRACLARAGFEVTPA